MLGSRWAPMPRLKLRSEIAFSKEVGGGLDRPGYAGQLWSHYRNESLEVKARGYWGQPGFAGRIRDERGLFVYARRALGAGAVMWTNFEMLSRPLRADGRPGDLARNLRVAGRWGDPGAEIVFDSRMNRGYEITGPKDLRSDILEATSWRFVGPLLLGVSGSAGLKKDERGAAYRAFVYGVGAEVVGSVLGLRTSVSVDRTVGRMTFGYADPPYVSVGGHDFGRIVNRCDFEVELRAVTPQLGLGVPVVARLVQVDQWGQLPPCPVLERVGHVALPAEEASINLRLFDEFHGPDSTAERGG